MEHPQAPAPSLADEPPSAPLTGNEQEGYEPDHAMAQHTADLLAVRQNLGQQRIELARKKVQWFLELHIGGVVQRPGGHGMHPNEIKAEIEKQQRIVDELQGLADQLTGREEADNVLEIPKLDVA